MNKKKHMYKLTMKALYNKNVKNLKAWELFLGQSTWFFIIGIVFFLIKYILNMSTSLKNSPRFQKGFSIVEKIGSGQALPSDGAKFTESLLTTTKPKPTPWNEE